MPFVFIKKEPSISCLSLENRLLKLGLLLQSNDKEKKNYYFFILFTIRISRCSRCSHSRCNSHFL